jgi:NAD(P)H dehydrogenase (quinone)
MSPEPTVLVTGAAGKLGRQVVDLLLAKGVTVIAGTRDPAKLASLAAKGVEVRRLDWTDEPSLAAAFSGIDRALLISGDQLPNRSENQVRAVNAATRAGVKFIAYTSMVSPERYQHIPIAPSHLATEQAIKASGMAYAILQNMWYPDGLVDALKRAIGSGRWDTSAGDGKVAYVTREDCARAAAAVLAASEQPIGTFVITGSEALSARDIAAIATSLTGKPIEVHPLTDDQATAGLSAAGLPGFVIDLVVGIDRLNREGGAARVSEDFRKLTGKPAESVRDWLASHKDALMG